MPPSKYIYIYIYIYDVCMPTTFSYMHRTIPLHQAAKQKLPDDLQTVLGSRVMDGAIHAETKG